QSSRFFFSLTKSIIKPINLHPSPSRSPIAYHISHPTSPSIMKSFHLLTMFIALLTSTVLAADENQASVTASSCLYCINVDVGGFCDLAGNRTSHSSLRSSLRKDAQGLPRISLALPYANGLAAFQKITHLPKHCRPVVCDCRQMQLLARQTVISLQDPTPSATTTVIIDDGATMTANDMTTMVESTLNPTTMMSSISPQITASAQTTDIIDTNLSPANGLIASLTSGAASIASEISTAITALPSAAGSAVGQATSAVGSVASVARSGGASLISAASSKASGVISSAASFVSSATSAPSSTSATKPNGAEGFMSQGSLVFAILAVFLGISASFLLFN
ncbi:hypothetical protein BJ875DRAFT_523770, partial [Amylocarpus encephaloides]